MSKGGKKSEIAKREEEILEFWKKNKIFEKTLKKESPKGEFVFYDGPPFATGLPHYGSLLSSIIKDVIPRYKTMRGYHVRRRWGWDCHGLPIENMIEKELGLADKTEIEEKVGVKKFNEACRNSVLRYAKDWKKFIERIARWVEYDNAYMTMDTDYTESVWWALKKIHEKGLLYEGRKVLLYCPHCETPIAKAEVQMDNSYKDVTEEAVTVKFRVKNPEGKGLPENTYFLAWTTTPWTLPGNVALAVGEDIDYELLEVGGEFYLLAGDRREIIEREYEKKKSLKGKDLIGLEYEPLYEIEAVKETGKKAWYVAEADFVNTEEGTGIVHTAVIYGEDDYALGERLDLPMVPLLDEKGHFTEKAPNIISGDYFKKAEKAIKKDLEEKNLLFDKRMHTHSYPHCHRCETALLYNAITSWFIDIQKIKDRIIKLNEKINWVPEHLKHGRFLNIIKAAPDWTISRNRYWASPLPIWKSESGKVEVIGSLSELKEKTKSDNKYFLMRHGEAESNVKGLISTDIESSNPLTEKGRREVEKTAEKLKKEKIEFIYASDFERTRETAEILAQKLGVPEEKVIFDKRIREYDAGELDGKNWEKYHSMFGNVRERFEKAPKGGETYNDLRKRIGDFLYEIDDKHEEDAILVVSHGLSLFTAMMVVDGLEEKDYEDSHLDHFKTGEARAFAFYKLPHDDNYELDYHRPYIDEITWTNEKGEEMTRTPEVVDGWVEAASMPFAEYHYPFENKEEFEKRFPGDFVAEYIAQTRTWFYYMLVIATALFDDVSFRNVLTTGTILAEDGSKMSKSKGNYTDPMENLDRYSADALRYYLMTSVVMRAEDLRFSDEEIKETQNKVINLLSNVFNFYRMYTEDSEKKPVEKPDSPNILDKWILLRLDGLKREVTKNLDEFNTIKAGRPIRDFILDFSQWYIRRSRDRFKSAPTPSKMNGSESRPESVGKDERDRQNAVLTTGYVLIEVSKIIAPFTPFVAEHIYKGAGGEKESVHLADWPLEETRDKPDSIWRKLFGFTRSRSEVDEEVIEKMKKVRNIVSLALEKRANVGIKVRQPLEKLKIKSQRSEFGDEFLNLIKEEVNVKEVAFDQSVENAVELDTEITPELKEEGMARDFTRAVQSIRKKEKLAPSDRITLLISSYPGFLKSFEEEIKKTAGLKKIETAENEGEEIQIGNQKIRIKIKE